jgi:predicted nucleic acid-binding protein
VARGLVYLDSSAIVKLVLPEKESPAVTALLPEFDGVVSSALAAVEVHRAVRRATSEDRVLRRAEQVLAGLHLLRLDDPVLDAAAALAPATLRTLDALHLVSALSLGEDLAAVVVYDDRLAGAARQAGLRVLAPE